jgi:hypothetical protein
MKPKTFIDAITIQSGSSAAEDDDVRLTGIITEIGHFNHILRDELRK